MQIFKSSTLFSFNDATNSSFKKLFNTKIHYSRNYTKSDDHYKKITVKITVFHLFC